MTEMPAALADASNCCRTQLLPSVLFQRPCTITEHSGMQRGIFSVCACHLRGCLSQMPVYKP